MFGTIYGRAHSFTIHMVLNALTLLSLSLFLTACNGGQQDAVSQQPAKRSAAAQVTLEQYDFYDPDTLLSLWDAPKTDILSNIVLKQDGGEIVAALPPQLAGFKTDLFLNFNDRDGLRQITYRFFNHNAKYSDFEEGYIKIQDRLTSIYGEPLSEATNWHINEDARQAYANRLDEALMDGVLTATTRWAVKGSTINMNLYGEKLERMPASLNIKVYFMQN